MYGDGLIVTSHQQYSHRRHSGGAHRGVGDMETASTRVSAAQNRRCSLNLDTDRRHTNIYESRFHLLKEINLFSLIISELQEKDHRMINC